MQGVSEMAAIKSVAFPASQCNNLYFILTERNSRIFNALEAGKLCFIDEKKYLDSVPEEFASLRPLSVTMLDEPAIKKEVDVNILQPLSKEQAALLMAITNTNDRLNCYLDRTTLEDALNSRLGQQVLVVDEQMCPAIIRYVGKIHDTSFLPRVYFGLELQGDGEGKGRTDGTFNNNRFFTCKKNCGLFKTFNKICFSATASKEQNEDEKGSNAVAVSPVKAGDKVGFYTEDVFKHGTVVVIHNEGPDRFVELSLEGEGESKDDLIRIPMESVVKEEILSPGVETDCGMDVDYPTRNQVKSSHIDPEADNSSSRLLGLNSMVQLNLENGNPVSGIIRWIGYLPSSPHRMAGVELDEEKGITDGNWKGKQYFRCPPKRAIFVKIQSCQPDMRFHSRSDALPKALDANAFKGPDGALVLENQPPLRNEMAVNVLRGRMRGIQGHCNSCYMDAALFSLFSCTSVLDSMLFMPPGPADVDIQMTLRDEIVNPLRLNGFVSASSVMKLRHQLTHESQCPSFATSEKDPEEFLNLIMHHILGIDPLLKLKSGGQKEQECYCYQIFMEKQEDMVMPDVQQLVAHSFLSSDLKLAEIPSCFIIQMPRFGKEYKMFSKIIPSLELDITDLLFESPRECIVCGELATFECPDCFHDKMFANSVFKQYCDKCCRKAHSHHKRKTHNPTKLRNPAAFQNSRNPSSSRIPREKMELFAVLCIETSHYVSFVKYGPEKENWMFFDSMADRYGDDVDGYNIPMVSLCPEVARYLASPVAELAEKPPREMQGVAKRLFCDAYMYMYQSKKMALYK